MQSAAGPAQASRSISGSTPGLLDSTQPGRLQHIPGSTLSFASFHPLAASSLHGLSSLRKISLNEELYRPKRVIIETVPGPGPRSYWRFVPRARLEPGVENEGSWPRIIEICGEFVHCSEDQWDIYKLDPEYDCLVRAAPHTTVISRKMEPSAAPSEGSLDIEDGATSKATRARSKRERTSSGNEGGSAEGARKRTKTMIIIHDSDSNESQEPVTSDDDDVDAVEELVKDDGEGNNIPKQPSPAPSGLPRQAAYQQRIQQRRERVEEMRRRRREPMAPKAQVASSSHDDMDIEMADVIMGEDRMSRTHVSDNVSPNKRGASTAEELQWSTTPAGSGNVPGGNQGTTIEEHVYRPNKRLRPWPPTDATPEEWKPRTRYPYVRRKKRAEKWWEERDQRYVDDLNIDIEAWAKAHASGGSSAQTTEDVYPRDGEANHRAAIEESRRKLAELERDRPLWEEAARRRQAEEEAARRAREQAERRAEAEEQRKRQEAAKAEEERRARAAKEKAAREEVQRRRQEQKRRWSSGLWTPQRALERYKQLCDEFDQAKYTEADPITFDIVPWPVLNSPVTLTVEDVDWAAVENFFQTVRRTMRGQDYKLFVEKSHRRFHPDRWRARGLFRSVQDEETRNCLEVAANTVTQAITPLWMEVKNL